MKIYYTKIILFSLIFVSAVYSQKQVDISKLRTNYVLKENVEKRKLKLNEQINFLFSQSFNKVDQTQLARQLYDLNITYTSSDSLDVNILHLLNNWHSLKSKLKYALFEYVSINFEDKFISPLKNIFNYESNPAFLAQAAALLYKNDTGKIFIDERITKIDSQINRENSVNVLRFFREESADGIQKLPPIRDLLNHDFQKGKTIIYSFQRKNRIYPGLTVIKNPNGKFLRNKDSSLFSIPQLAYSVSNMPWFITNGNTPQGIYSIVGWYITPTKSIGPTPIILTRIPYEKPPNIFFHGGNEQNSWNMADYKNLLPKTWREYSPIYQSYYAGMIGRRLIVMHGSADDLSDYEGKPFYPLSPTRGCLSSKEIWSDTTGECLESDQVKLVNAFFSTKQLKGFLVVVEIDDKEEPVIIKDVEQFINQAD
ncbi:MAG: hypothetical protein HND52_02030 [Ignavibacteriae bacterium]|nr:hypothetical protein [Ignavibacteriota bacterium]NOG96730.1 hypothetical protein [Ignavibacteriota bacterium]